MGWVELQLNNSRCCECDSPKADWDVEFIKLDESHQRWEQWDREVSALRSAQSRASSAGSSSRTTTSRAARSRVALSSPAINVITPSNKLTGIRANAEDIEAAKILVQMSRDDMKLKDVNIARRR